LSRNASSHAARLILPHVEPFSWLARRMLSAKRRNRARFSGPWSLRAGDWSSSMTTSRTQCRRFSTCQWARTTSRSARPRGAWTGGSSGPGGQRSRAVRRARPRRGGPCPGGSRSGHDRRRPSAPPRRARHRDRRQQLDVLEERLLVAVDGEHIVAAALENRFCGRLLAMHRIGGHRVRGRGDPAPRGSSHPVSRGPEARARRRSRWTCRRPCAARAPAACRRRRR
jgi:hypothetical protein